MSSLKFSFEFAGLEKNKLFVKDLNKETSRDQLEELFTKFGPLKEVRLITLRNGHSKGMAYVEYVDEVSAARALVQTDGECYFLSFFPPSFLFFFLSFFLFVFRSFVSFFIYSNDPNTGLVRYSNGLKLSDQQMVWISNGI